ncbi:hypothetical protein FACS18942_05050 [Planctomycetales bacterium]|nr:hypothetical protein FACS18942_05050 [Planctomycetales bacterium]GHT37029.1 hypothetical protein FACS189427_09480 [Planctomycetales bacterium]
MNEADILRIIAEYDKQQIENSAWNKFKKFVRANFQTIIIFILLFYTIGGFRLFENFIGKFFNIQINNAVIQRIIPNNEQKSFIERIQRIFKSEYNTKEEFAADYRMSTSDFRYKYPELRKVNIESKETLQKFIGQDAVNVPLPNDNSHSSVVPAKFFIPPPRDNDVPIIKENQGNTAIKEKGGYSCKDGVCYPVRQTRVRWR